MRKSLMVAATFMLLLLSFPALIDNARNSNQTGFVAYAGRTLPDGRWCDCGTQGCQCDPGEEPCTSCPNQSLVTQRPTESEPVEAEAGTGITLIVAAAFLVLRLRQIV